MALKIRSKMKFKFLHVISEYRKNSIKPPGGLFNFGPSRVGLNREGDLFTKSSEKDIFGSFSVLLFHILRIQHTILRLCIELKSFKQVGVKFHYIFL